MIFLIQFGSCEVRHLNLASAQKSLVHVSRQQIKMCSKDSFILPQKEHAGDGIIPILFKKEYLTRHLLSNLISLICKLIRLVSYRSKHI